MTEYSSLMPVAQAVERVLQDAAHCVTAEEVALEQADGRVLLEEINAACDVPPWDNSAMDGYAVLARDAAAGAVLPVSQRIPAGTAPAPLTPGSAARIFTGAPIPERADAVVMQENCEQLGEGRIRVLQAPGSGENVRRRGNDIRQGSTLLRAGQRLRPMDLGLLASTGVARVSAGKRPTVALLSTGDELAVPGEVLQSAQIYHSNGPVLKAMLRRLGLEVVDLGRVKDSRPATEDALIQAAGLADCILSTGGVSAGEEDHVRAALSAHGQLDIWKLALKPGKPFAYGYINKHHMDQPAGNKVLFFGLPGNPVSAFVTFILLVRPALLRMMGAEVCEPGWRWLKAGFEAPRSGERQEYLRVCIEPCGHGEANLQSILLPLSNQSSGVGSSLSYADGLAVIPPHTAVKPGDLLRFLSFAEIF